MKDKKTIIIIVLIAIIAIMGIILLTNNKKEEQKKEEPKTVEPTKKEEKITITFDSDGGEEVEKIILEKGSELELPNTSKKDYTFLGWYKDDTKIEDKTKFEEDTTLVAKWEKIKEDAKTMKITFHSNGGTSVNSITLDCSKVVSFPKNPTREGYTFVSWVTKKGKVINNGSKLDCNNIDLYANWKKNEEPKKEEPKKEEPKKTYTCPDGYTLNGTKCIISENAKEKCDGDREYNYEDKCVTINNSVRKDPKYTCGKTTVHTGGGHTEEVQGELFKMGTNYCFFKVVTDSYENNQSNCTSRGHKWNSENKKCYYYRGDANQYVTSTCNHLSGYAYIKDPNSYQGVNGLNGGCYPVSEKTKYCDKEGYTLTGGKCIKTIDAELK